MRGRACIALVIASTAMVAAGISTRGARADRSIAVPDLDMPIVDASSQRPQQGPRMAALPPAAQRAVDFVAVAAVARHPGGPDNAGAGRDEAGGAVERLASLEVKPGRKMRALSMEPFEMPVEGVQAESDQPLQGQPLQGQSGAAHAGRRSAGDRDSVDAARTVIRLDRVVININFSGFGS